MLITATRLKDSLSDDKSFFWFYIGIELQRTADDIPFSGIALVEYHLLHESFPNPDVRVTNPANGFQYKLWTYGFFRVSADIITKDGKLLRLPATRLSGPVTPAEIKANGKRELSW